MRIEPLLVLVSGEQHTNPLAFATTAKGLHFTSCSGLFISTDNARSSLVLMPAAVLRPWLQPGSSWLTSLGSIDPPPLTTDCGICAVGPVSALSGGAATCIPIATVRVSAVSRAAAQLLQGLNRDTLVSNWDFEWHIGGASCTAAEQGAFVLCWTQPLHASPPGAAAAAAGLAPSLSQPCGPAPLRPLPAGCNGGTTTTITATLAGPGPLSNPQCLQLLESLHASLSQEPLTAVIASATATATASPCAAAPVNAAGDSPGGAAAALAAVEPPCTCPGATPGCLVSIVGSPFGCLAPFHFSNAHINGAVACAFHAPAPPTDAAAAAARLPPSTEAPHTAGCCAAAAAVVAAGCGCGLGPALYALDAHVLPGMEGALVRPLQPPPPPPSEPRARVASDEASDVASCCCGGGSGCNTHTGACRLQLRSERQRQRQPLALLCTPVSRRADGVQVPLAAAWPHVAAALARVLGQLLRRALGQAAADGAAARRPLAADGGGGPSRQQLQLQPVAWHPVGGGGGGGCRAGLVSGTTSRLSPSLYGTARWADTHGATEAGTGTGTGSGRCVVISSANVDYGGGSPPPAAAAPPPGGFTQLCAAAAAGDGAAALLTAAAAGGGPSPAAAGATAAAVLAAVPATAAAAAAAASCACPPGGAAGLPPWVLQAVVLLRCNGSWATGVLVEARTGLLLTTAHLFQRQPGGGGGGGSRSGKGPGAGGGGDAWGHLPCWARVPWVSSGGGDGDGPACGSCGAAASGRGPSYRWLRARVLYMWANHLDLAVLQLEPLFGSRWAQPGAAAPPPVALAAVRQTACAREEGAREVFAFRRHPVFGPAAPEGRADGSGGGGDGEGEGGVTPGPAAVVVGDGGWGPALQPLDPVGDPHGMYDTYGAGSPVWAVGHSLVGPAAEWPALVSYGCVARVLRSRGGRPTMVVATTATHAGGSGGALLDGGGRLVGLVTSNARHAGGTTLPNLAFCIAAEELAPVVRWAAAMAAAAAATPWEGGWPAPVVAAAPGLGLSALEALDEEDEDAARIWRLQMPSLDPPAAQAGVVAAAAAAAAAPSTSPAASGLDPESRSGAARADVMSRL
ncbi:hypothetical protein PLESTM_000245700 [Pleodorina starrii]|nr:hypothetical protein PLESTM_000245700 [Pleodorina starrii]